MATQHEPTAAAISPMANRLVFVFSLAGAAVAGFLWWTHATGKDIPCGGSGGCDIVAASPYSHLFGIPVAAFGTACYLLLAGLAFARALGTSRDRDRQIVAVLAVLAGAGALFSLWLTYLELFVIRAVCRWCIASQMLILVVFGAALWDLLRSRPYERRSSENA